jgi:predicted flap endonuclease-1-like 5' DNA nuclease
MIASPALAAASWGIGDIWPVLVAVAAVAYLAGVLVAHRRSRAATATAVAEVTDQLLESRREAIHHESNAAWLSFRLEEAAAEVARLRAHPPTEGNGGPGALTLDLRAGSGRLGVWLRPDDLKVIDGIGPKIEGLLNRAGIRTWDQLAEASPEGLSGILAGAGPHFRLHDPSSWPQQAALLARGEWAEFVRMTSRTAPGS